MSTDSNQRRGLALALAVAINAAAIGALTAAFEIGVERADDTSEEPNIVTVTRYVRAPPAAALIAPIELTALKPQFMARAALAPAHGRNGDPALAVWKYLCNRDTALGETVARSCPGFSLGQDNLAVGGPLARDEGEAVYGRQVATREAPAGAARDRLDAYPWDVTSTSSKTPLEGQIQ